MDLRRLEEQVQMVQTIGFTLNVEEKLRLKLAYANVLQAHPELDEVKFWGRIEGLTKSYYVLLGLTFRKAYQFPHKTFFYALSNDFEFKDIPELLVQHEGHTEKFNAMPFVGDPAKILVNVEGEGGQEEGQANEEASGEPKVEKIEEQDDEVKKIPKKNFTELNRLAHVIRAIENDCQCVPKGSYKMTPQHELRPNTNFYGIDPNWCRSPQNWQHFRSPTTLPARSAIEDNNVVFSTNFLDTIEFDVPYGSWSIQVDSKQRNVTLRSLKWPGYFAFHQVSTDLYGGAYFGDGIKNIELPFML